MIYPCEYATVSFERIKEIGFEGKNSNVYIAKDIHLDAEIVIKKIEKSSIHEDTYFNEARVLYASSHPNVVQILYSCFDNEHIYIAMPYYKNNSLKRMMSSKFLTNREVIKLTTEFLSGLQNIHSKGLIHFDIKPDNIMLSDRGEALLSDFGLAKYVVDGLASPDLTYPRAIPPELIQEYKADNPNILFDRTYDIYQTGLTIYRMCVGDQEYYEQFNSFIDNGKLDIESLHNAQIQLSFPDLCKIPAHIDTKLIKTIKKCLHHDPSKRFASAIDIINSLSNIDGKILDWEYNIEEGSRIWSKKTPDDKSFTLTVHPDNSSTASKKINGKTTNIKLYCLKSIDDSKIKEFLETY